MGYSYKMTHFTFFCTLQCNLQIFLFKCLSLSLAFHQKLTVLVNCNIFCIMECGKVHPSPDVWKYALANNQKSENYNNRYYKNLSANNTNKRKIAYAIISDAKKQLPFHPMIIHSIIVYYTLYDRALYTTEV